MARNLLTAAEVKGTESRPDKNLKLNDGGGLYLLISKAGSKIWRVRYFIGKSKERKEQTEVLGAYPYISLKEAREKRDILLRNLYNDVLPANKTKEIDDEIQLDKEHSFYYVAQEYLETKKNNINEKTLARTERLLRNTYPTLGDLGIKSIRKNDIFDVLKKIESNGFVENRIKTQSAIAAVFRYAWNAGYCDVNPATDFGKDAFISVKRKNRPACLNNKRLSEILKLIWDFNARMVTVNYAMRLLPYLCLRPGEMLKLRWKNINFDERRIEYVQGKGELPHIVPLSEQVFSMLEELKSYKFESEFVFCNTRNKFKSISDNTINKNYRALGVDTKKEHCGHGWRAVFFTKNLERYGSDAIVKIELCLGHTIKNANGTAYHRAEFINERAKLMVEWADYLDGLRNNK